jgi:hypothetical protein
VQHRLHVGRHKFVATAAVARLHGGHEERDHDHDHAVGGLTRIDVPAHVSVHLLRPNQLGHRLAQLLQRWDV